MSSGPSSRKEKPRAGVVELEGGNAKIQHDAIAGVGKADPCRENSPSTKVQAPGEMLRPAPGRARWRRDRGRCPARGNRRLPEWRGHSRRRRRCRRYSCAPSRGCRASITSASITGIWPLMQRLLRRAGAQHAVFRRGPAPRLRWAHSGPHPRSGISAPCRQRRRDPSGRHVRSSHRAGARGPARPPPAIGCARSAPSPGRQTRARKTDPAPPSVRADRIQQRLAEGFQRRIDEAGADINAGGVLGREDVPVGRRNADPPLAIERTHHRRNERLDRPGHGTQAPSSRETWAAGRSAGGQAGCRDPWDSMG